MNDLVWGDLDAAVWGLVALGLLFGFIWLALWRRAQLGRLARLGPLPGLLDASGGGRLAVRAVLVIAAAALIVAGLMRPQLGARATELKNLGIDVAVVLDASKSMKVGDIVPNRLDAAKLEIHRLIDRVHGGRIGLVPFAGLAFLQTPLTSDFDVIATYLDDLRVEDMPRGGTAVGRALIEAVRALVPPEQLEGTLAEIAEAADGGDPGGPPDVSPADVSQVPEFTGSKYKAIVLITDGEDHEGDPLAVADLAKRLGIRVYTIGVGTAQGRPVPIVNDEGATIGTMKGPDGKTPLFSELNEALLRDISARTGGEYFHLGPTGMGDGLIRAIDGLEKQEYDATFKHLRDDRYQLALVPALLLLLIEALLGGRRRRRREGRA